MDYGYDPVTGLVTGISARRNGQPLFGQACSWTTAGNLEWRTDTTLNLREDFGYDRFNRLTSATAESVDGLTSYYDLGFDYEPNGNISQKEGVGVYEYGFETEPYAVKSMSV